MFRPSRKLLFAIEAVLDIAYNAGTEPVQSSEITRRQGIPRRYLEQALQQLVREGILAGVRGPRGGYRLAHERRRTTLGAVVRAVMALETQGERDEEETGSPLGQRIVWPMFRDIHERVMRELDEVTLDDLCRRAHDDGIQRESASPIDFVI